MLALSFTFPGGRYHATPWDRHVNEGAVAWPPEPWRLCRALIATWHHKVKPHGRHDKAILNSLLEALAQELPEYGLPAATHSHTRHYMPQRERKAILQFDGAGRRTALIKKSSSWVPDTALVFDAFTAVDKTAPLTVTWPHVELDDSQNRLLDALLECMTYLGRAESWVEARRLAEPADSNCRPGTETLDTETGEIKGETVTLFAPLSPSDYQAVRARFLAGNKVPKKLQETLPGGFMEALSVETGDLRKQGWNQPPAAQKVSYIRPVDALRPNRRIIHSEPPSASTAQFIVVGKPLPRVEDSLRIGELARMAVMGRAKGPFGENNVPPVFSGHDMPAGNRHQHAFYLPWDSDGDGRIDRLLIHVPAGMDAAQQKVIQKLDRLWDRNGGEWRLVLESLGPNNQNALLAPARTWRSITPYLHPWHCKKRLTVEDQIRRECRERGLSEPTAIEWHETISVGHTRRRPVHFRRFRNKRVKHQPDRLGQFCSLTFAEDINGPLALGFACHFGLGLFAPGDRRNLLSQMPDVGLDQDFERQQGDEAANVSD
jgi:CRISPR-associated protein Csb2